MIVHVPLLSPVHSNLGWLGMTHWGFTHGHLTTFAEPTHLAENDPRFQAHSARPARPTSATERPV